MTGTTTSLSALGIDDGGEAALSYTWTVVSGPAGVTFSQSGSNAAKSTTATFTRAGDYVLRVTATDVGGLTGAVVIRSRDAQPAPPGGAPAERTAAATPCGSS